MGFFDTVTVNLTTVNGQADDVGGGLVQTDAGNGKETALTATVADVESQPLSHHETLFVNEYLKTFSAVQAARNARYAPSAGNGLLKRPHIRKAIQVAIGADAMKPDEIIARYSRIARADMGDFVTVDESGYARVNLKDASDAGQLGLIKKLEYDSKSNLPRVEMVDQLEALEKLGRIHGMFTERVQIDSHMVVDAAVTRQIMVTAMKDPATLAELGELAERLQANQAAGNAPVVVNALPGNS